MRLVLDHLAAGAVSGIDHAFGHIQAAAVVDADLGDDQWRVLGADVAVGDFHGCISLKGQTAVQPPSTKNCCPVEYAEASDTR